MGAGAVAVGPLIGGAATTYVSWRWVFAGEVVLVLGILVLARRVADAPPAGRVRLDVVGAVLIAVGLGLGGLWGVAVGGVGLGAAQAGRPLAARGVTHGLVGSRWVAGGLAVPGMGGPPGGRRPGAAGAALDLRQPPDDRRAGHVLHRIPGAGRVVLHHSAVLVGRPGLSALETGVRILPLSITLLAAAIGIPRLFPDASPRRVVRLGLLAMFAGIVVLLAALDADADARIVTVPLLLAGLGIGALASQLGAVTVSAVPDTLSPEVGGLQNTATNLGAAVGTALAGSLLIATLTAAFLQGVQENPAIPEQVKSQASIQLASGVPFLSDADLEAALQNAGVSTQVTTTALEVNRDARVAGLRSALAVLALIALVGLFSARRVPSRQPQSSPG
jgi:hypothetical protein